MSVPDEAVEAAAKAHQAERSKLGYSDWDELNGLGKEWRLDHMRKALTAAAPFIAAQATALIADLLDPDPCSFDHNHSCQAHGYYYLKQDEACPQHDAKEWVKAYLRSGT